MKEKALRFWNWFTENQNKYLFIIEVDPEERDRLLDEFLTELHQFSEGTFFEMGGDPNAKMELIITADGDVEYFKDVEFLVEHAPSFTNWEVIPFKPPMGNAFTTTYGDVEFDPHKIIFIPLSSKSNPENIGIRVCYNDYEEENKVVFINGTYLMLDVILGEKSVVEDIQYLEVVRTPDNIGTLDFRHLCDIKEFIDEQKNRN